MHIRIENIKELKVAVRHLKRLATKNTIYALNSIKVASAGGSVSLMASNGSTLLQYTPKEASSTEDIEFLLDAKYLSDLLKTVKDPLVFEVDTDKVTIVSGKLRHQTSIESADAFPLDAFPLLDIVPQATLPAHPILAAIQEASLFVSKDEVRANLMCVALGPERIMSTDGHRLYLRHITLPLPSEINITPIVCELLKVLSTDSPLDVRITSAGFYSLEQGSWFIQCAEDRVDAPLPDLAVIADFFRPDADANTLTVDSKELAIALEASKLSWDTLNTVTLAGDADGNAYLTSGDFSMHIGQASLNTSISINGRYALDVVKTLTGDMVILFSGGTAPVIFHAAMMGTTIKDMGCVIMPLRDQR